MVSVVILALALVTPAFTFPFSAQRPVTSGVSSTHTGVETVSAGLTHEEKTGIVGQSQVFTPTISVETGSPITQQVEKIGLQGVPQTQVDHHVTNSARPEVQGEHSGLTEKTTSYNVVHNVVPVEFQTSPETNVNPKNTENQPTVVKTQEVVSSEQTQGTHTEQPVLLPVQPLSVLPVTPLVVPAEAISTGRLIIMAVEPMRQRLLQDVTISPEKQVTQQQTVEQYVPVQTQVVEPSQQVFNLQSEVVTNPGSSVEKQGQYQQELQSSVTSFIPVQTQVPQIRNHPIVGEYNPIPSQTVEQHLPQTPIGDVEKQGSTYNPTQTQGYEQDQQVHNTQQNVKTNVEEQQQHQVDHTTSQVSAYEPSNLQQVYHAQIEQVVPNQQIFPQTTQNQVHKTQEVGSQQPYSGVPSPVCNYAASAPVSSNFGDRIHQNQQSQSNYEPSQILSVAPFSHVSPVIVPQQHEQQQQVASQ